MIRDKKRSKEKGDLKYNKRNNRRYRFLIEENRKINVFVNIYMYISSKGHPLEAYTDN